MALRKTESRIPEGYNASDLGYTTKESISEDKKYALICDFCSPLSINPSQVKNLALEYVCFVKEDNQIKDVLDLYTFDWAVEIEHAGVPFPRSIGTTYIKASESTMRLVKLKHQNTFFINGDSALIVTVTIFKNGNELKTLSLTHEIVEESTTKEPYPITYALEQIPKISAAGTPEVTSNFIYFYMNYIMYSICYSDTHPAPAPPPIPIIFLSTILYPRALARGKSKLPKIEKMIQSDSINLDFINYELGTFLITPYIVSKYISKFSDLYFEDKKKKETFNSLTPKKKLNRLIDIYNVMRFPKSSIQIVADILKEIISNNNEIKNMKWVVVGDINKDKCERVMEIFLCELKSSETNLNDFTTYKLFTPYIQRFELSGLRALSITKDPYKKMEYTFRDGSKIVRNTAELVQVGNETKKIGTISFITKDNTNIFTLHDKCGDFYELLRISTNDWFNEKTRGTANPVSFIIKNEIVVSSLDKFLNHAIEKYYSNYKQNTNIIKPGYRFEGGNNRATNKRGSGTFKYIIIEQQATDGTNKWGFNCVACSVFMIYSSLGLIRPDLSRVEIQRRYSHLAANRSEWLSKQYKPTDVELFNHEVSFTICLEGWKGPNTPKYFSEKANILSGDKKKGSDWAKLSGMNDIKFIPLPFHNLSDIKSHLSTFTCRWHDTSEGHYLALAGKETMATREIAVINNPWNEELIDNLISIGLKTNKEFTQISVSKTWAIKKP